MTTPAKQPKIVRLIKYYWSTRRLVGFVTDWYVLPLAYLGLINLSNGRVLHLKNQLQFKVKHFLDAVGILEVFVDNEYHFPKVTKKFTVVDIGANIGAFTIFAALKSPQVKVISYEPSKSTYQLLNYNVETNGLSEQVMTNQLAAWGKQTTLKLYNPGPSGLRSLYQTRKETKYEAVKTVTLKNIFLKNKLAEIDY
jgi:FkbM family methyltransferase